MAAPAVTAPRGLTTEEASKRREESGPNALPEAPRDPLWRRFARQFRSPLIYVLLFALVVDLVAWRLEGGSGLPFEALAIAAILLLNAGLGVWQERKAEGALEKLRELAAPHVWVMRDGKLVQLPGRDLVPGDVVRLEAGDRTPADATARTAQNLAVDESVLTGESFPVEKAIESDVLAGTLVVRGKCYVEVVRTGPHSAMGRLAAMLGGVEEEQTPLERRLEAFGHRVAGWVLGLAALLVAAGVVVEGPSRFEHVFLFAVALAVAAVPEGLPAVLTVTLALGVERMAKRKAVVRRLAAVEALGSVTVIVTDKTGTLTENRMEVKEIDSPDPERAVRAMILANEAELDIGAGDPLELALLRHAQGRGDDLESIRSAFTRESTRAFDSRWKYMRVTGTEEGRTVSYLKGAPEVILERCELSPGERDEWKAKTDAHAGEGFRLLALGFCESESEEHLAFLGLVKLWDPPRPEVAEAIRRAGEAGIRVVMVTGDHPATARTVAGALGIENGRVVTGADLQSIPEEELRRELGRTRVFARVSPEDKLRIVEALQAEGEIVAMTGDGVNDAPALKRSDVGVGMGQRGSDVTREVADLVLLDDNFATIVAAIEEGRSIYENIQKLIRFLFSTNLSEVLVVTVGALASFALGLRDATGDLWLPLTAAQLLWINLVTDGAPAIALGLDRNPGVLTRPPRDPASPLLDRLSLRFILLAGGAKALVAGAILALLPPVLGESLEATRTSTFLFLAAGQLLITYPARHTELQPSPNRVVHGAVLASFAAQLLVVFISPLGMAFDTVSLNAAAWAWVGASIVVSWGFAELASRLLWRGRRASDASAQKPRREDQDRSQELEDAVHGDADEPKGQHEKPDEGVQN